MPRIPFSPRVAFAAFLVALFVWVVLDALVGYGQRSTRAALFPLVIGVPALGLSVLAMVGELRQTRSAGPQPGGGPAMPPTASGVSDAVARRRTIVILAWVVGFYLSISWLGFMLTAPLATLLYIRVAGKEAWPIALGGGAISWLAFNGVFECVLSIPLERRLGGALIERLEEALDIDINQFFLVPFIC